MDIRKFDKKALLDNLDLFCDLYRKSFTAEANREIIGQRYLNNPYDELLMYIAMDDDKIVANYSAVPIRIVVDGIERKAALSLNTMTDPMYAGRGLFTKLASALYDHLSDNDYAIIIGFPNALSNRIFNTRLGWSTVLEIPTLSLDLNKTSIQQTCADVTYFDSFEDLEGATVLEDIHVALSREYIAWRFQNNKEKEYNALSIDKGNWLIYQFYDNEINITEINCSDRTKEERLIEKIINLGSKEGFASVTTWCKLNTARHSYLEKRGFQLSSPIRTFGLRCFDVSIAGKVYDPRKWCIQMGDDNTY